MPGAFRAVLVSAAALLAAAAVAVTPAAAGRDVAGAVYTLTNGAGGSAVLVFDRAKDGTLSAAGSVPTGGVGNGSGLGSQGAIVLGETGKWLYAVNYGSNTISVLEVKKKNDVKLVATGASGGARPVSLTVDGNWLYVVNQGTGGTPANIAGFRIGSHGELSPLVGSSRPLSAASVSPAQIQFSPDGRVLVVTEKATNSIDTYVVGKDGLTTGPNVQPSAGTTPFGFDFDKRGHLIVSDAFNGAAGASGLSSYSLSSGGVLGTITPFVPNGQTAACWVVTTKDGRYAYTTNTGSASISSYSIGRDGSIALLAAVAGATGATPIDAARDKESRYFYTLDAGAHAISAFAVRKDGSLSPVAGVGGLPAGSVGLAAQ